MSQYIAVCVVHSSFLAWISSVHIEKVLSWLGFRKNYVLKASFSKNLLQITDVNFLSTTSKPNGFWDANFPSSIFKPSRFWNANFPPYVSPTKNKSKTPFEKYKPRGLFSQFNGNLDSGEAENENDFFHLSVFLFDLFLCAFYPPENIYLRNIKEEVFLM